MRARRLQYSEESKRDLRSIRRYLTASASPGLAARMIIRLRSAIAAAREMPGAGTPRPEFGDVRFVIERPYVVYYDYDGDTMTVLRVLHQARNRDEILS